MLSDFRLILCAYVYVLYDYSYISAPPLVVALPHACSFYLAKLSIAEIPVLNFSRMAGRGRAANEPPPPSDYMAAMMQQFELNRQYMENVMAQFPQPNQHGHHH